MPRRQRGTVRRRCCDYSMNTWLRLPAVCVLVACSLSGCAAQVYSNPFNVTNNGAIGANTGPLLPRLSTYIPTGTFFTNATVSLGTTSYRAIGQATEQIIMGNATAASLFSTALYQSFSEQYQIFNLLCTFGAVLPAVSAPITPVGDGNATDPVAAAAPYGFNSAQQYAAVDVTVTISAGTDLAARLTGGWLPVGKYAPITEASMRQRGYELQILPLNSTVTNTGATQVFPHLPAPNTTAFQLVLNLTGVPIVPFNVQKQTALLSVLLRNFPRLALGVGPTQYQVASVVDDAASQTAQVTMILLSSGSAQAFAERLTQSLGFALASYYVAGLPCNYTVVSLSAVSGYTLQDQVAKINKTPLTAPPALNQTELIRFSTPPPINVSSVPAGNMTNSTAPLELGTVWYRLVGVNLTESNIVADAEPAVTLITARGNMNITFGPFVQVVAPEAGVTPLVGKRKLLQTRVLAPVDTDFNNHNSYTAVDVNVTYLANMATRLPVTWLPLSQYANYFEEVMRFKGYQIQWLTLGAELAPSSAKLYLQLPQIDTVAYQANITLVGTGLAAPVAPLTLAEQTAILTLFQELLPPLFFGLGPQWTRFQSVQSDVATNTTNFSLLMDSILPPIWNDTDDTFPFLFNTSFNLFPQQLTVAGLDSTVTLNSVEPVNGFTLEAQMRALNGLPVINVEPASASNSTSGGGGGGGISGGAIAGIVVGALAVLAILAAVAALLLVRKRRREAALRDERDAIPVMKRGGSNAAFMFNGTGGTVGSQASVGSGADGRRGKDYFGHMDGAIKGWDIDIAEIEFALRPDGSEWLLGEGSYGKVYRAVRGGVQDVAVKVLNHTENDPRQIAAFEKEISILKSISYDRNIVQFYGAVLSGSEPMLVLEYMEGGDLRAALSGDLTGELRWYHRGQHIALDVARGLHYLHSHDVMHSDIKARNVLLSGNRDVAKISDVGVAKFLNEMATQTQSAYVAWTFAYAAPEILMNQKSGSQADVYSFGVMLWEIVTGLVPTRGGLTDVTVPDDCPQEIADLIQSCLQLDPMARPTAKDCFTIIKRCMRDGFSDEPHSVGSGVPSVVVPSFISTAYTGTDTSRGGSELGDPQPPARDEVQSVALGKEAAVQEEPQSAAQDGAYVPPHS